MAKCCSHENRLSCEVHWRSLAEGMQASVLMPQRSRSILRPLRAEDMVDVANELLRSYLVLVERGHQQHAIAQAMLGATVNLFDLFDLSEDLPVVLRALAERLECGRAMS